MAGRSPARYLAPLALVGTAVVLFVVVTRTASDSSSASGANTPAVTGTATPKGSAAKHKGRRSYTVRRGDTASAIAQKAGVTLTQLKRLNPKLDVQSLSPGQKVILRR
jgi:LysM repeat protein